MLTIDGSFGEGGGQILRSSLAMSLITGTAVRLINIRANRDQPGLRRQHLTCVEAAAEIGRAEVEGARLGATELSFRPNKVEAGDYTFSVGTAGSTSLVFQTVLPPLLLAPGTSRLRFEGGTHNSKSPPFDFLARVFVPVLLKMGADLEVVLERCGFYPKGGGAFTAKIEGGRPLAPIELVERGAIIAERARSVVVRLPKKIADRELAVVKSHLALTELSPEVLESGPGPGNVVFIEAEMETNRELVTGFGEKGKPAEAVAEEAVAEYVEWKRFEVPVGAHLADQLLIPFALAGGGVYRTAPLTLHTTTNIEVLKKFLELEVAQAAETSGAVRVEVKSGRAL